ncbi:TylF/MycF/NovP-related O-methyltransferase [Pseudomonas sp. P3C3]
MKNNNPNMYVSELISKVRSLGAGLYADSLNSIPFCFSGDGLSVYGRNLGFLSDERFTTAFTESLERFEVPELQDVLRSIIWRKHIVCSLASQAVSVPGDFVECGVEWGFGVDVVSRYLDFSKVEKSWYLYDTYSGVPLEDKDEGFEISGVVTQASQFDKVKRKFSSLHNIIPVQGRLPDILSVACPEKIAFLHIDLNNVAAEVSTFVALYPRISMGGVVIFDDYGALLFARQHVVERDYLRKLGVVITELPTGQALLVKTRELDFGFSAVDELEKYDFASHVAQAERLRPSQREAEQAVLDVIAAYDYFRKQLEYISNFASGCNDVAKAAFLDGLVKKLDGVSFEFVDGIYKYTSVQDYQLAGSREVRFDLQQKIDYLQRVIDSGFDCE